MNVYLSKATLICLLAWMVATGCVHNTRTVSYEWSYEGADGPRTKKCIKRCDAAAQSSAEELACIRSCPGVDRYESDCADDELEMCVSEQLEELDLFRTGYRTVLVVGGVAVTVAVGLILLLSTGPRGFAGP